MRKHKNRKFTMLLGITCLMFVVGLAACGSSSDTASNTPPVVNPPTGGGDGGGGGGNPPPPVTNGAWGFDYKLCTTVTNVPEILVKEREMSWGDSMDVRILPAMYVQNGKTCYEGRIEKNEPEFWHDGKWFVAAFYGNDDGDYHAFVNGGMAKNDVYIDGVLDRCMVIGTFHNGKQKAKITGADSVAHTVFDKNRGQIGLGEYFLPCNNGEQCPVDCKGDIPDDGVHDINDLED